MVISSLVGCSLFFFSEDLRQGTYNRKITRAVLDSWAGVESIATSRPECNVDMVLM
jgi:hypothetical protein